jgi:glycosyltransferase involved in cell wall biosynthesis
MKILFCSNTFQNITNGPAKFASLLLTLNHVYPQHEIRIVTEDVDADQGDQSKIDVYKVILRIPFWLKPLGQILRMFAYYQKVKQIKSEYAFDILIYNNAFNGLWASWVSPVPTVGMINDEKNIRATLATIKPDRWWIKQFFFKQLEKLSTRSHKAIITNSDFLKERVIHAYRLSPGKVYRLYKSIDIRHIVYQPDRNFETPIQVLFVKADYRVGNLAVLIRALATLTQYKFVVTVIGPESRFKSEIRSFVPQTDTISLNYLGPQPQAVVYEYLRRNDIFCVPSNTEALGVANIEALAHGIPVISSQVGGIPEVLNYGANGWLVTPNDSSALASAFQECITNSILRKQKSEQGKQFVERFTKDVMLDEFIKIVENVCNKPVQK